MKIDPIDITIVAGRRPLLLQKTLESFKSQLFDHFHVQNIFINIDPWGGSDQDHADCLKICDHLIPDAQIFQPETASFGNAVMRLWKAVESSVSFHLEDDWVANEVITPEDIAPLFENNVAQVSLMNKNKHWRGKMQYHCQRKKIGKLPMRRYRMDFPVFTTSPSFICHDFIAKSLPLMNPDLDPEKQFYNGCNPNLAQSVNHLRNRFYIGKSSPHVITDIGREWRNEHSMVKDVIEGESIWTYE